MRKLVLEVSCFWILMFVCMYCYYFLLNIWFSVPQSLSSSFITQLRLLHLLQIRWWCSYCSKHVWDFRTFFCLQLQTFTFFSSTFSVPSLPFFTPLLLLCFWIHHHSFCLCVSAWEREACGPKDHIIECDCADIRWKINQWSNHVISLCISPAGDLLTTKLCLVCCFLFFCSW